MGQESKVFAEALRLLYARPIVRVTNKMPVDSGILVSRVGVIFHYRKLDGTMVNETVIRDNLSLQHNESVDVEGTKESCCKLTQTLIQIRRGNEYANLPVANDEPPEGECRTFVEYIVAPKRAIPEGGMLSLFESTPSVVAEVVELRHGQAII